MPNRTPTLFPVLLVNFIGMLGYSLIIPLLVFLVEGFGGNAFIYGLLGATYPAFQLVGAPLLGKWSDRIGRRRVLIISQAGTFLAWGLFITSLLLPLWPVAEIDSGSLGQFSLTVPLLLLFLARALDGLTGGNVSVANAYLADISDDSNRKANFGKLGASTSMGFVIGPVLAGLLGATALGSLLPVMVAALVSLVAIGVIYWYLPESQPELVAQNEVAKDSWLHKLFGHEHKECYELEDCVPEKFGLPQVLRISGLPLLFLIYFLTFFGFSFFYSGFPVFASNGLGWTSFQLGIFLAISSGIMILAQGPILSWLGSRLSDATVVRIGAGLLATSFFILPLGTVFFVYLANLFLSLGNGLMWPSFLAILGQTGPKDRQGSIQGYANSMGSLASIFGLISGGMLFALLGPNIFYIGAVLISGIFVLSFRLE
ncbi:MAG: MFS transporter [Bacteroidota bacterium]